MILFTLIIGTILSFGEISKERKPEISLTLKSNLSTVQVDKKVPKNIALEKEQNNCAKLPLSAIYSAQNAYHLENLRFAESFQQVGYATGTEEEKDCAHWNISIHTVKNGAGFEAFAENKDTGELWKMDDTKHLAQEKKGQP